MLAFLKAQNNGGKAGRLASPYYQSAYRGLALGGINHGCEKRDEIKAHLLPDTFLYCHVCSKFTIFFATRSVIIQPYASCYKLSLLRRSWVQILALAISRRKTGGEDNHRGKSSSFFCELVGLIPGIFYYRSSLGLSSFSELVGALLAPFMREKNPFH